FHRESQVPISNLQSLISALGNDESGLVSRSARRAARLGHVSVKGIGAAWATREFGIGAGHGGHGRCRSIQAVAGVRREPSAREFARRIFTAMRRGGYGAAGRARRTEIFKPLRAAASDPRWRVREGVAMGLQRWGERDMDALLDTMETWRDWNLLEQRAVVA